MIGLGLRLTQTSVNAAGGSGEPPLSLDSELERTLLRSYAFDSMPYVVRKSGTASVLVESPNLVLQPNAAGAGANRYVEIALERLATDVPLEGIDSTDWYAYTNEIACHVGPYWVGGAKTNTMLTGIQFGSFSTAAPFPSISDDAVCQLRWNHGRQKWELVSAPGDSATATTVVDLVGIPTMVEGGGARCRLRYDPFTPKLSAWVNGVLGAEITDPTKLPIFGNSPTGALGGMFCHSGSSADSSIYGVFAACHCKLYDFSSPGSSLSWYP